MGLFKNNTSDFRDLIKEYNAIKCKDHEYDCPKCGYEYKDTEQYKVNGETYPKMLNESKGATMDGSYWDWDELHCCEKCKTKYWFQNGAF